MGYDVYDTKDGTIRSTAVSRGAARAIADKLDAEFGTSGRFVVKPDAADRAGVVDYLTRLAEAEDDARELRQFRNTGDNQWS